MALSPNTISTSIIPNYTRELRDQVCMTTGALDFMMDNVDPVEGGLSIKDQIGYLQSPNADVFAGGTATLPASFQEVATEATFSPCYYYFSISIPDTVIILNKDEGAVLDVVTTQYENALQALNTRLGSDIYGDGTPRAGCNVIMGFNAINTKGSEPGGGAYGGIARTGSSGDFKTPSGDTPWWNANVLNISGGAQTVWKGSVNTGTTTNLTLNAIQCLVSVCQIGPYRPKAIFAGLTAFNAYQNLLFSTVRQAPSPDGNQGFKGLAYADIGIFQDDPCDTGTMYTANSLLKLRPWSGGFFRMLPWQRPPFSMTSVKYGLVVIQVTHKRPNTMGKLYGITGS